MTFVEAKAQADAIGGVVDWWCSYSVHTAEAWKSYNGTRGYGCYISKGAEKYFHSEYMKWKRAKSKELAEFKRKLHVQNLIVLSILNKIGAAYMVVWFFRL